MYMPAVGEDCSKKRFQEVLSSHVVLRISQLYLLLMFYTGSQCNILTSPKQVLTSPKQSVPFIIALLSLKS